MSGIDLIIKNNPKKDGESLSSRENILINKLNSDKEILTESESLINSYNNTLENIKFLHTVYLIYFQQHFKITGCPDLVLKSLWVIFCVAKKRFKNEQTDKRLIHFLFAKLNLFFNLENSSNYFKTYLNADHSSLQNWNSNRNSLIAQNLPETAFSHTYYSNLQEKEFFDDVFFKIFKLNSVLDKELNENYLDSVLKISIINENLNIASQKEEIFNISVFDTNEITIEKNENRQENKFLIDLTLNEEEDHTKNDNTKQSFVDSKQDSADLNKVKHNRVFPFKNLNITSSLINRLNEDNDWTFENINILNRKNSKNLKTPYKITDFDYSRILVILTKFYNKYFLNKGDLDELLIYENINLDKFLESCRNLSPLSNSNSTQTCIENFPNYFFTPKEEKIETPKQASNQNNKYNCFIESLSNYYYNDTYYLIKKYKLKFYFQTNQLEDFCYCSIYENFYEKFLKKNDYLYKEIDKIKSSYDKNIFLKLIDDYISSLLINFRKESQLKEKEQNIEKDKEINKDPKMLKIFSFSEFYERFGFDLQFFENLFIIAYFIYLNLLLVEKPNMDECIYSYIKSINSYQNVNYSLIFSQIENLNKLNYSSSIKKILKNFNNLIVSLVLVSKDSFLHKKAIQMNAKEKITLKLEEILKPDINEKEANYLLYQEFKEKNIKVN